VAHPSRRALLLSGGAAVLGAGVLGAAAPAAATPDAPVHGPADALSRLLAGNRRFRTGHAPTWTTAG
jgi:carbonic anhydrase